MLRWLVGFVWLELQVTEKLLQETRSTESASIGSFFGWGMAAIYVGGRFPQIILNVSISQMQ